MGADARVLRLAAPATVVVALLLGAVAAANGMAAIGLVIALGVAVAITRRPAMILVVLIVAVFTQSVSVGGLTVGRLVAPLAVVTLLAAAALGYARLRMASPLFWAGAFGVWATASGWWTASLDGTVNRLAALGIAFIYMIAFASLVISRRELALTVSALVACAFVGGLVSLGSFFLGFNAGINVTGEQIGRATGGAGDPNFFATYQLVALPLVLVLASEAREMWARIALYATLLVIVGSVLASLSRGALLMLVAIVFLLMVLPSRTFFPSRRRKAGIVAAIFISATLAFLGASKTLVPRVESVFTQGSGRTGSGRLYEWRAAEKVILENPLLGIGHGSYHVLSNELFAQTPGVDLGRIALHPEGVYAHNTYLETAAELGIPGLLLFLGILASTARALAVAASNARRVGDLLMMRIANALLVSLFGWSISAFFLSAQTSRPLWIISGLSLAVPRLIGKRRALTVLDEGWTAS